MFNSNALSHRILNGNTCGIDVPPIKIFGKTIFPGRTYLIDGIWHPLLHTCRLDTNNTLPASAILTIPDHTTLKMNDFSLTNHGVIDNQGTITCGISFLGTLESPATGNTRQGSGNSCHISNYGIITNENTLDVNSPILLSSLLNFGSFTNTGEGTLSCTASGILNEGQILNEGGNIKMKLCPMLNRKGAKFVNDKGGMVTVVECTIYNDGGVISNAGSITFGSFKTVSAPNPTKYTLGYLLTVPKLAVPLPGLLENYNGGMVLNNDSGYLSFKYNSELDNGANFAAVHSAIKNVDFVVPPASFSVRSTVVNNGTIDFIGSAMWDNAGTITNLNGGVMKFWAWGYLSILSRAIQLFAFPSYFLIGVNSSNMANASAVDYPFFPRVIVDSSGPNSWGADESLSHVVNYGTINLGDITHFTNTGNFTSYGEILFGRDGTIARQEGIHDSLGVFDNYGQIINYQELFNYGNFTLGNYTSGNAVYGGTVVNKVGATVISNNSQTINELIIYCSPQPTCSELYYSIHPTNYYDYSAGTIPGDTTLNSESNYITPTILNLTSVPINTTSTTTTTTSTTSAACDISNATSCTSSSDIQGGSALVDQNSSTGVYVQLNAPFASNGTSVNVTSSDLGGNPSGTHNIQLSGESFYDVNVSQNLGSSAVATICISSNVTSPTTTMEYYNGTTWVDAFYVTVSGNTVCGTIPVSALTGTPIVIGSPIIVPPRPTSKVAVNLTIVLPNAHPNFNLEGSKGDWIIYPQFSLYAPSIFGSLTPSWSSMAVAQVGHGSNGYNYSDYLGYFQTVNAGSNLGSPVVVLSGFNVGANVSITASYDGVSVSGSAILPAIGNTTTINLVLNLTKSRNQAATSQSLFGFVGISAPFISAILFMVATGNFRESLSNLSSNYKIERRLYSEPLHMVVENILRAEAGSLLAGC